jgi:hypothetical protein
LPQIARFHSHAALGLFLIACVALLTSLFAERAEGQVGLSTFVLDLLVSPGQTSEDVFSVVNNGEASQYIRIEAVDWMPTGPSMQDYFPSGTLARSVSDWLDFWPAEARIAPGESLQVRVSVSPPASAEGCYWGMLFVRLLPSSSAADMGEMQAQVGMNVIFGVAIYAETGDGELQGRIVGFSCEPLDADRQRLFTLDFEDTGITRLRPTGTIQIRNEEGNIVRELALPQFSSLPDTVQRLQVPLTRVLSERPGVENSEPTEPQPPLPAGTYLAIAIIDYGGDALVAAQLPFEIQDDESY